jgi:hypothetical protein
MFRGGPGSSVGITVRGSNPGGDEIFRTCTDRTWGPPSLLYNGYRIFPRGRKRPRRDADPSLPSSAEVYKQSRAIPLLSLRAFVACKTCETYLHVSSITCSSSGGVTQTALGVFRVCYVSWLHQN